MLKRVSALCTDLFALWVVLFAAAGYFFPGSFVFFLQHIRIALGIIMFGMGMTLSLADFKRVFQQPGPALLGVCLQYMVMPSAAYLIARALNLPGELAVGVILLGACPGGTASNVITFLARGDVALSVSMTTLSTMLSPVLTPAITYWLASRWMAVDPWSLFVSVVQIVLVPVFLGVMVHTFFSATAKRCRNILPLVSVVVIALVVAAIVGKEAGLIRTSGLRVLAAVVLHNGTGLALGWLGARILRTAVPTRRAITIEVGMQNSGLATALAQAHISSIAALPGAVFSIWHNISGPILASIWRTIDKKNRSMPDSIDRDNPGEPLSA